MTNWDKVFAASLPDKWIIVQVYTELWSTEGQKANISTEKWEKIWADNAQKIYKTVLKI